MVLYINNFPSFPRRGVMPERSRRGGFLILLIALYSYDEKYFINCVLSKTAGF